MRKNTTEQEEKGDGQEARLMSKAEADGCCKTAADTELCCVAAAESSRAHRRFHSQSRTISTIERQKASILYGWDKASQ